MKLRFASLLAVPALLLACSSNSGSGNVGSDTPCGRYFNALTTYAQRCGQSTGYEGQSGIAARFETVCNNAATAPGALNVSSEVDGCATRINGLGCTEEPDCVLGAGSLDDGAACQDDYQCKGFCKRNGSDALCGTCAASVPVGGKCDTGSTCATGSHCDFAAGTQGTCVAKTTTPRTTVAIGEACKSSLDCDQTKAECKESKCTALPAENQECTYLCAQGLACSQEKKCVKPTFVKNGELCDLTRLCQDSICVGLGFESTSNSDGTSGTMTVHPGTCRAPLADGAACTKDDKTNHCNVFAECVQGTCQVPNPSVCK